MTRVQLSAHRPILEYSRAAAFVFNIQNESQVDLRSLIKLLQVFFSLPEDQVLLPLASDYPPLDGLQQQITLAIDSADTRSLAWERLGRALPVVVTLYDLYFMRIDAIATQNSTTSGHTWIHPPADVTVSVPHEELIDAARRVDLLRPIDGIIEYHYDAFKRRTLGDRALAYVVDFAYRIISHHGPEHAVSGQSTQDYLHGLRRDGSRKYLAFVYLSTQLLARPDEISPAEVLHWAEETTEPISGAAEQGDFLVRLFPAKTFDITKYLGLSSLARHAVRSPYEVWPALDGCCLGCGRDNARYSCSLCGKIKYCCEDCQKRHWKASHKIACALYRS